MTLGYVTLTVKASQDSKLTPFTDNGSTGSPATMANGSTLPRAGHQLRLSSLPWVILPLTPPPIICHFIHLIMEASFVDLNTGS